MRVVAIRQFGGPECLAVIDAPQLEPAEGQALVAVEAIGVGSVDAMIRSGALAAFGFKEGFVPGSEIAGTVVAVGQHVDKTLVGRRMWAFTGSGGYAEQKIVAATALVPLPERVSAAEAVTIASSGVVAHFGLRRAHFRAGESVLVRGAAGGIGLMAVQLAALGGASDVAVTTSSSERGDRLRSLGATEILNRAGEDETGIQKMFDVVIDVVGGSDLSSVFAKLNPNGRIVAVGAVSGFPRPDFAREMYPAFQRSLSFATFSAVAVPESERWALVEQLFQAASRGDVKAIVHKSFPLEEAILAHRLIEAGSVFGRLVLVP